MDFIIAELPVTGPNAEVIPDFIFALCHPPICL
jgi:hypothetical protein